MKYFFLLFIGYISVVKPTAGLRCYGCSIAETDIDADETCMTDKATVINCNKPYCVTIRQEYKDPRNKLASLYKGCTDVPQYMNDIKEDETYRYYYYGCQSDLCNKGPGKDNSQEKRYLGDKSTIYCPGIGRSSSSHIFISSYMILIPVNILFMQFFI